MKTMYRPADGQNGSPTLSPADHVTLMVELLRPMTPELARRWVAALMRVPAAERGALVESIERRVDEVYGEDE